MSEHNRQLIVAAGRSCERMLRWAHIAYMYGDLEEAAYMFEAAERESAFAFDVAKRGQ